MNTLFSNGPTVSLSIRSSWRLEVGGPVHTVRVPAPWQLDRAVQYRPNRADARLGELVPDFLDTPAGGGGVLHEVRTWLAEHLVGEFAELGGGGGPSDETAWELRGRVGEACWARPLGRARLARGVRRAQRELRRADHLQRGVRGYGRADLRSFFGEGLFADGARACGTEEQKRRFLPKIQSAEELVPGVLGAERRLRPVERRRARCSTAISGSTGRRCGRRSSTQWCFGVVRTDPDAPAHKGLSYVLVPMDQTGVSVRPLKQMTGTAEFNEVFFDDARTDKANVVGEVNDGWKVAWQRWVSSAGPFLAQQIAFQRETSELIEVAHKNGATADLSIRREARRRMSASRS